MDPIPRQSYIQNLLSGIIHFPLTQIILAIILVNIPTFIFRNIAQSILSVFSINNEFTINLIIFIVRILSVYFMYDLYVKIFEKRKAREIQIGRQALKELILGLLLGFICILAVSSILLIWKKISIISLDWSAPLDRSFFTHIFYAFLQDIIYFMIIFRISEKWLGSWLAIFIASFIFGFKHMLFPGYTLWSAIAQSIEAGLLFSMLFVLTRRIWAMFGFHLMWNFMQYGILGFPEFDRIPSLLKVEYGGPDIITGAPVGLEASLITFLLISGLGLYLLYLAIKNNNLIVSYWRKSSAKDE